MVIILKPSLNYSKRDPKFTLLEKIFKIIDDKRALDIYARNGVKNCKMMVICIKIIFLSMFFDYTVTGVIDEVNRDFKLKKFLKIEGDVPTADQVFEYMSRYSPLQYNNIFNSVLSVFYNKKRNRRNTYIIDATPVACDINIVKKYVTAERLEKLKLKWGFSTTKGYFIGFKVSMVLDKESMCPIQVLIHPGAPNDAKLFEIILKELKRRRLIQYHDVILADRGYYALKNYNIGILRYKILPIIFPRSCYSKDKIQNALNYSLDVFHKTNKAKLLKTQIKELYKDLIEELDNWKDLKPIRGIIEDFFKAAKGAFGLDVFHSFTEKSMHKNIYLCLLLTSLVVQYGFKTKRKLQQLSEGIIDGRPPKNKTKTKNKDNSKNHAKEKAPYKTEQEELLIMGKEEQKSLEFFA